MLNHKVLIGKSVAWFEEMRNKSLSEMKYKAHGVQKPRQYISTARLRAPRNEVIRSRRHLLRVS